nr:TMEM175 family protein [Lacticaseibacillus manihotivorans]
MSKHRVEAFTDGVIAIIITIMVLELQAQLAATSLTCGPCGIGS